MADVNKILSLVDLVGGEAKYKAYQNAVEKCLPKDQAFDRYWTIYRQILNTLYNNEKITRKDTILPCLFNAAKLGLNPDPVFGQIYFIPYKGELTYQLGYKGMIELSRRSGKVLAIRSGQVFEKDKWHYFEDEKGQHFNHEPNFAEPMRGRELFVWSVFEYLDGARSIHVMPSKHVEDIKKMVLARTPSSPWSNPVFEPEMRKKTCVRQQWKMEPWSVELAQSIQYEEALERGEIQPQKHDELAKVVEMADIPTSLECEPSQEVAQNNAEYLNIANPK